MKLKNLQLVLFSIFMVFLFAQTPNVFAELCDDDGPGGANFHCISKKYVEGGSGNRITIQTPDLFIEEEQCLTEIANVNQWIVFDNGRFVEIGITAGTITDKDVGVTECLESETIYHTYKSATYQEHKIETVPVGSIQSFEISNINGDLLWDVYWLNNDEKNPIITRLMPDSVAQNQDVGYETSVASSEYTSIPETHFSGVQTYDGSSWASWNDKIVQNTKSGGDSGTTLISCNDSKDHFHGGNFLFSECTETISLWIKESTAAWTQGHHGDAEYVANIGFLIDNGIIPVNAQTTANNPEIPPFVKDVADWWSQGLVTDTEYINALTYLVENGIIILQGEDEESTTSALLSLAQNFDTYTTGDVTITPISDPSRGCQPNCYSPSVVTVDSGSTITVHRMMQ